MLIALLGVLITLYRYYGTGRRYARIYHASSTPARPPSHSLFYSVVHSTLPLDPLRLPVLGPLTVCRSVDTMSCTCWVSPRSLSCCAFSTGRRTQCCSSTTIAALQSHPIPDGSLPTCSLPACGHLRFFLVVYSVYKCIGVKTCREIGPCCRWLIQPAARQCWIVVADAASPT